MIPENSNCGTGNNCSIFYWASLNSLILLILGDDLQNILMKYWHQLGVVRSSFSPYKTFSWLAHFGQLNSHRSCVSSPGKWAVGLSGVKVPSNFSITLVHASGSPAAFIWRPCLMTSGNISHGLNTCQTHHTFESSSYLLKGIAGVSQDRYVGWSHAISRQVWKAWKCQEILEQQTFPGQ